MFTLSPETTQLLGPEFPADVRAILEFTLEAPSVFDHVLEAVRSGAGVPPGVYERVGAAAAGVNTPTYAAALVPEWIAGVPGLTDRLSSGATVADLAAGNGDAAALVAQAFPEARVLGYDLADGARDNLPANLRMRVADVRDLPDDGPFDLMYCLDSFHHLGDPQVVLAQVHRLLASDGVLMIVEAGMTGDLDQDVADPFATVVYAAGLLYCLQESLHAGGGARSGGDGTGWIEEALQVAGFGSIAVTPSATGYAVVTASPTGT